VRKGLKLTAIEALKNAKNGFDRSVDRSVELHFGLCFQQRRMGGGVFWLKDTGRGLQNRVIW